ncbi:MAG TPA: hypothetical protein VHI54_03575 [Actinomycetota bacterium]|nr:hypothetical protein [Actinomycetota bacterium]
MSQPIVFISRFKVKDGKLEQFREFSRKAQPALEAEKPRTVGFLMYLNEGGTDLSIVHVFPDAESMAIHFEGADERSKAAYEFIEPAGWEIYGAPTQAALETMKEAASKAGVSLKVQPEMMGGFLRST